MHIFGSLSGYFFLTLSCVYAFLLLLQVHWLKSPMRLQNKLPPIEQTHADMLLFLKLGFLFLTLGVVGGLVSMQAVHKSPVLFTLGSWVIYVLILVVQYRKGLPPRLAGASVLGGWLFLTFAYFGTKLISGYH